MRFQNVSKRVLDLGNQEMGGNYEVTMKARVNSSEKDNFVTWRNKKIVVDDKQQVAQTGAVVIQDLDACGSNVANSVADNDFETAPVAN